jgi:hypothetical protein
VGEVGAGGVGVEGCVRRGGVEGGGAAGIACVLLVVMALVVGSMGGGALLEGKTDFWSCAGRGASRSTACCLCSSFEHVRNAGSA